MILFLMNTKSFGTIKQIFLSIFNFYAMGPPKVDAFNLSFFEKNWHFPNFFEIEILTVIFPVAAIPTSRQNPRQRLRGSILLQGNRKGEQWQKSLKLVFKIITCWQRRKLL